MIYQTKERFWNISNYTNQSCDDIWKLDTECILPIKSGLQFL